MVLMLFNSYKQIISYDRAKLKNVGDFYVLTWLIFTGPVTYVYVFPHCITSDKKLKNYSLRGVTFAEMQIVY